LQRTLNAATHVVSGTHE